MLVKNNHTFYARFCSPMHLRLKVGKNDIRSQFYQYFTRRSKKCKNIVKPSAFFALLGSVQSKAAHRMLMKSTPGVNFTNILPADFTSKKHSQAVCLFCTFRIYSHQSFCKMLVKLIPGVNITNVLRW